MFLRRHRNNVYIYFMTNLNGVDESCYGGPSMSVVVVMLPQQ